MIEQSSLSLNLVTNQQLDMSSEFGNSFGLQFAPKWGSEPGPLKSQSLNSAAMHRWLDWYSKTLISIFVKRIVFTVIALKQ